jgi:hypothetical protein
MKCLVCGREMLVEEDRFECPNILCDYYEDIEGELVRSPESIIAVLDL